MAIASTGNIELFLLNIFKWVVIATMVILIAGALWLAGTGVVQISRTEATPPVPKTAPAPAVAVSGFLEAVRPPKVEKTADTAQPLAAATTLETDTAEAKFKAQAEGLWPIISKYQVDCGTSSPLSKVDFQESLQRTPLKRILETRDADFALSQVAFVKEALASQDILKLCKSGIGGLFMGALEFHRSSWDEQVQEARDFENRELSRVAEFKAREQAAVQDSKASAYKTFLSAAIAFGLFMSVAMVLIFARIESNLRGVKMIVSTTE